MVAVMTSRGQRRMARWVTALVLFVATGCSSGASDTAKSSPEGVSANGPSTTVVVDGLDRPTQIADGPDGTLLIAQLAGEENASTGEVIVIDVVSGSRRVLLSGLDKPTGVAWSKGVLWVMERRSLVRAAWSDPASMPERPSAVVQNLPFNDRSEGTLTVLGDGRIVYETSGAITKGSVLPGSGTLWGFDPVKNTSIAIAVGIKNAYAHAQLADGRIVTSDIGDNIANAPVEEVDVVDASGGPADLGWPDCPGDATCANVTRPLAVFTPSATPTGVAAIGDDIYITLFVTGQLMKVSMHGWVPGEPPVQPVEVAAGLQGPHTVLARPDGSLWISEHLAGRVVSLRP
jgi:glucose/arabinose dehydrogenase